MRRFLSTLSILLILAIIVLIAAFLLAPDQFDQTWRQAGLPTETLNQGRALAGQTPLEAPSTLRLYGELEATETHAMSEIPGRVTAVLVGEGELVGAGAPLVELDPTQVEAEITAAAQALETARAAREAAAAPPDETIVAVADSVVSAAETRLANAQRTLAQAQDDLDHPLSLDAQINQTAALIPAAKAGVERAEANVSQIDVLLEQARTDGSREGKFTASMLEKKKAAAEAEVEAAQARLQGLRRALSLLRAMKEDPITLEAQVHQAENGVKLAETALTVARAERDVAAEPPAPAAIAIADARVQKAEAALALAQWKADHLQVVAPASGRAFNRLIEPGETIAPGQALFTIAALDEMELRIYVAERDLHRIQVGDSLPVETPLLPGQTLAATVFYIAPEAQFRPNNVLNPDDRGDMVFLAKLRLPNSDGVLKPGMPADVLLPLE